MRRLFGASILIVVVLLVPIVPFLFLGESFEDSVESFVERESERSDIFQASLIVGVLAADIFLPIPSSAVSTYGGAVLGTWPGTLASWLGMTLGSVFGFSLARGFGRPFAAWLSGTEDLERMEGFTKRFGPLALVLTRALPILAEACVLLMGATRLSWRRFLVPVVVCNLVIAFVYSACGEYFKGQDALPIAIATSGTVPLLIALIVRRLLPTVSLDSDEDRSITAKDGSRNN